jgi:CRP-like cAMP-binding protein
MSTFRPRHLKGSKRAPAVVAVNAAAVGTLFGQLIAEPLRHLLGHHPFPARLNDYHLRRLSASNKTKSIDKGGVLFKEGELPHAVYVVLSGRVKKFIARQEHGLGIFRSRQRPGTRR